MQGSLSGVPQERVCRGRWNSGLRVLVWGFNTIGFPCNKTSGRVRKADSSCWKLLCEPAAKEVNLRSSAPTDKVPLK